jgi:hypothetical protein
MAAVWVVVEIEPVATVVLVGEAVKHLLALHPLVREIPQAPLHHRETMVEMGLVILAQQIPVVLGVVEAHLQQEVLVALLQAAQVATGAMEKHLLFLV